MPSEFVEPVTLKGRHVELVPLAPHRAKPLARAVHDGELWKLWYTSAPAPEAMASEIARRLALQAAGAMLPFTVLAPVEFPNTNAADVTTPATSELPATDSDQSPASTTGDARTQTASGVPASNPHEPLTPSTGETRTPATSEPVGMTTYMNIDPVHRRVEIGSTWYARRVQRTPLNTEAKLLLLTHAFDTLDCIAVELRTHFLNHPSRRAIERLGAKLDGILRAHQRAANGTLRDTCVYSITAAEWPAIRTHLEWQLNRPR